MTKSITVQVRLTPAEHKLWLAAAKQDGRTLSGWIRRQCELMRPHWLKP